MTIDEKGCIQITETKELEGLFKVIELWKKSAVVTGYNEEGGQWEVVAGANRKEIDSRDLIDKDSISVEIFNNLKKCHDTEVKQFEVVQLTMLRFHGCPSCYIIIPPGPPICVC